MAPLNATPGDGHLRLADAHIHLFDGGYAGTYGRSAAGGDDLDIYESLRPVHNVDVALVIGYEGEAPYATNNAHIAMLAAEHDWIHPLRYTAASAPCVPERPFLGLVLFLEDLTDARAFATWPRECLNALSERRAILSVNATPESLAAVAPTLRTMEGATILISHIGLPGQTPTPPSPADVARVLAPLLSLADCANIGVKVSGLYDISIPRHGYPHIAARPFVESIVERFGVERLYWASDFPAALDYVSFRQTISAVADLGTWSSKDVSAVMGGNLRRLLSGLAAPKTPA